MRMKINKKRKKKYIPEEDHIGIDDSKLKFQRAIDVFEMDDFESIESGNSDDYQSWQGVCNCDDDEDECLY